MPFVQPSQITRKKNIEEVLPHQSRQFQHHLNDNNNIVASTTLCVNILSINSEEEIKEAPKLISCNDYEGIAKKDTKDDEEVKFEVKECVNEP